MCMGGYATSCLYRVLCIATGSERSACDIHRAFVYLQVQKEHPGFKIIRKAGSTCQCELELGVE